MNLTLKFCGLVAVIFLILVVCFAARGWTAPPEITWTSIGNPGNAPDANGHGAVQYDYQISKYEVDCNNYAVFLNWKDPTGANTLGLYFRTMSSPTSYGGISYTPGNSNGQKYRVIPGHELSPVNHINFFEAVRFANWLNNGKANGDTETGAYTLLGGTPVPSNASSITRNSGAKVFLPNDDEWYKAAYYDPATSSYFLYPTASNTAPTAASPPGGVNAANYSNVTGHQQDMGAYTLSPSPYGTFDQAGNLKEYTETPFGNGTYVVRGGDWFNSALLLSSANFTSGFSNNDTEAGFRVASIPEPSSLALAGLGFASVTAWVLRRRVGRPNRS